LGRRWKDFQDDPDQERMNRYQALFDADKKRYDDAKAEKTVTKQTAKPKSVYLNFCAEQRKTRPKINLKELSIMWAAVKQNPDQLALYAI
jgi:hypothetical protein